MAKQAVSRSISGAPRKRRAAERKEGVGGAPMHALVAAPSHAQIAQRAFELYLSRGAADGSDLNDWLLAERQLSATQN